MSAIRPIGEFTAAAKASTPNTRRKIATRTSQVLVFVLSLSAGYLLCGHLLHGYLKNVSYGRADELGGVEGEPLSDRARGGVTSLPTSTATHGAANRIHTLTTSNGSPYQNYQMRIAYASYKRMIAMPGGEHHVAFTRILHRTARDVDVLAGEIPTFRAEPLQPECDDWCPYPVSDRANAVSQYWAHAAREGIPQNADWFYMIESDYIFLKPLLPPSSKLDRNKGYGFYFRYIQPQDHPDEIGKLRYDGPPGDVPPTGRCSSALHHIFMPRLAHSRSALVFLRQGRRQYS